MSQDKIIKILKKNGRLFATQIINIMRTDDEPKEFVRKTLKQMRKYNDINFICVGIENKKHHLLKYKQTNVSKWKIIKDTLMFKKFPELQNKKITRECYLYFIK